MEITFIVEPCVESGGFVARWDDPAGGGITTQGDDLAELQRMVSDAVGGYFHDGKAPSRVRLHFVHDPVFAVA
jgi:predicted RNase H-like HicB family nuclease